MKFGMEVMPIECTLPLRWSGTETKTTVGAPERSGRGGQSSSANNHENKCEAVVGRSPKARREYGVDKSGMVRGAMARVERLNARKKPRVRRTGWKGRAPREAEHLIATGRLSWAT